MHFCLDLCIVNKGEKFYAFLKGEVALCMYEFTCSVGVCICAGGAFLGILLIVLCALLLPMVLSPFRFFLKGRRFLELSPASDLFSAYSCF